MSAGWRPVSRSEALIGLLVVVLALAGIAALTEALRHPTVPLESTPPVDPRDDPRQEITCPHPMPREGDLRLGAVTGDPEFSAVSSDDLYNCPEFYDAQIVSFQGEVVGAVMRREEGAWLQLNDDVYADLLGPLPAHRDLRGGNSGVGVLVPHEVADEIETVGGPGTRGDLLSVVGLFYRVDPATLEVAVIRATGGQVLRHGEAIAEPRLPARERVAWVLVVLAVVAVAGERARSARHRRGSFTS